MTTANWSVTAADAIEAEDVRRICERIQDLPALTRQVVTLSKVYGYSMGEIVARLAIPEAEVIWHITQAVRACADMGEVADA